MREEKRKEYKGPIPTNEIDELLTQAKITYYFWAWETLFKLDVPLLNIYIGSSIGERHDKFRATMLENKVRVKYVNHGHTSKK